MARGCRFCLAPARMSPRPPSCCKRYGCGWDEPIGGRSWTGVWHEVRCGAQGQDSRATPARLPGPDCLPDPRGRQLIALGELTENEAIDLDRIAEVVEELIN